MITPAFHFNILEEFIHVFNGQSDIMVHKLKKAIENSDSFDIYPFITRCTLDIICGKFTDSYSNDIINVYFITSVL